MTIQPPQHTSDDAPDPGATGRHVSMVVPRRTLVRTVEIVGVGLFTGRTVVLRLYPAAPGSGIVFRRSDVQGSEAVPATAASLVGQRGGMPARNTCLGGGPAGGVMTAEHVLSALCAMGVTDVLLEIDGPEVPIGDGSAAMFVEAIERAGLQDHGEPLPPLVIDREITVQAGNGRISAMPRQAAGWRFRYELDYGPTGPIPAQAAEHEGPDAAAYAREIAPARTFCLQSEAEAMRAMGLFTALTPRDMLVFGPSGPIDNELRFENEPARHKLLDLIGDLSLAGRPLQVDVVAVRAGHALNHEMARRLIEAAV